MEIKFFDKINDYSILCEWWKSHKHVIISEKSLPLGVMVYINNKPICASFLYTMDNCEMSQIAWTTSNPDSGLKQRHTAIETAIDSLIIVANKLNKKDIITFTNSTGLVKIFRKKGLTENSSHTLMIGSF